MALSTKTPRERYYNDPAFKALVDMMVAHINDARYTPSEMRQAAILASIIYEEHKIRVLPVAKSVESSLKAIEGWLDGKS